MKVRFGMVGGGQGAFIGNIHRIAAAMDGELELVCGAFSQNPENSAATGQMLGLPSDRVYSSYEAMFETEAKLPASERMEFVAIVTPNFLHFPVAKSAATHGFHIFCEKPATFSLAECVELKNIIETHNVKFMLAHTYLGYPLVKEARHLVASGQIGDVKKIVVEYSQGWLAKIHCTEINKQAEWRLDPARAGLSSCMGDIGSHAANLAEFISGKKIASVLSDLGYVVEGRQLDDDCSVLLKLSDDVRGVLIASQISVGEENNLNIKVYGERGNIKWAQQEPNTLYLTQDQGATQILRAGQGYLQDTSLAYTRTPPGHPEGYIEAFANLYKEFAAAVKHSREAETGDAQATLTCSIDDALHGMGVLQATIDSHKNGNVWTAVP